MACKWAGVAIAFALGCAGGESPAALVVEAGVVEAGAIDSAPPRDVAAEVVDESPPTEGSIFPVDDARQTFASCLAIKLAKPASPDGNYTLDGAPVPFTVYCDMTADEGGWTLVTHKMLQATEGTSITALPSDDARGGAVLQIFANIGGCSDAPHPRHRTLLKDLVPWTRIRADYVFAGTAACWSTFGNDVRSGELKSTLQPFAPALDVIRDAKRMGGSAGDAFDGASARCDNLGTNFWHPDNGPAPRSATTILRRVSPSAPSGLTLGVDCNTAGPATSSPTWWRYSNIYVR